MGLPARRLDTEHIPSHPRPDLRVVKKSSAKAGKSKAAGRAHRGGVARQNFQMFVVLVAVVAVLGLGRIWLSVLAAEASLDANQLRHDIKNARYEGDMLEIQQSALASPSRIRAIASAAFDMAPAEDVTYIDIRETRRPDVAKSVPATPQQTGGSKMGGVIGDVLDLAAGEAQVLLVGDVGLAAAR